MQWRKYAVIGKAVNGGRVRLHVLTVDPPIRQAWQRLRYVSLSCILQHPTWSPSPMLSMQPPPSKVLVSQRLWRET